MTSHIILTLISLLILAMGFSGIQLPFISLYINSNKILSKSPSETDFDIPEFEDDPDAEYRVIRKQLKPEINTKRLDELLPKIHDEYLFRIVSMKRKVSDQTSVK